LVAVVVAVVVVGVVAAAVAVLSFVVEVEEQHSLIVNSPARPTQTF
jgi:hypothetical protein